MYQKPRPSNSRWTPAPAPRQWRGVDDRQMLETPELKVYTGAPTEDHIHFKDKYYSSHRVELLRHTARRATISTEDLHDDYATLAVPSNPAQTTMPLSLAEHEGKYVVLSGSITPDQLASGFVTANIFHKMLLKKAFLWDSK